MESPTLFRTFASVSTLGHRGLPVGLTRLLLLKEVESRLAAFARAEVLRPCSLAVRSIARQTLGWVSLTMAGAPCSPERMNCNNPVRGESVPPQGQERAA